MTNASGWRIACASVIGTSHERMGLVCQDSHALSLTVGESGTTLVVVASDGAGSAPCSAIGSQLACASIIEQSQLAFASGISIGQISQNTIHEWIAVVRNVIASQAGNDNRPTRDYACTLLGAVVTWGESLYFQIGDGAIVVADENSNWRWVTWPERGEFANTTYFVTEDIAFDHIQFAKLSAPVEELAVFTDGLEPLVLQYGTKSVYAPYFDAAFKPVRSSSATGQDGELSQKLAAYLGSPTINERTDDDKTLIMATRRKPLAQSAAI